MIDNALMVTLSSFIGPISAIQVCKTMVYQNVLVHLEGESNTTEVHTAYTL